MLSNLDNVLMGEKVKETATGFTAQVIRNDLRGSKPLAVVIDQTEQQTVVQMDQDELNERFENVPYSWTLYASIYKKIDTGSYRHDISSVDQDPAVPEGYVRVSQEPVTLEEGRIRTNIATAAEETQ